MMEKFDPEKQAFELKKVEWVTKEVQRVQELIKKGEGRDLSGEEVALLKQQLEDSFKRPTA